MGKDDEVAKQCWTLCKKDPEAWRATCARLPSEQDEANKLLGEATQHLFARHRTGVVATATLEAIMRVLPTVALVLALLGAACGGSDNSPSSPTASNKNPTLASVTVTPAFGVAYLTTFTFTASASDPDGDALAYVWTFVDGFRGQIATGSSATVQGTFQVAFPATGVKARLTVTDGNGGSAAAESTGFVVGSMSVDWRVTSSKFPGVAMFYLHLTQDSQGRVTGEIRDGGDSKLGATAPDAPGQIDAQGRLTLLRLKFTSGMDVTINGQMQPDGIRVIGTFVNARGATYNGVRLEGLPVTLEIDLGMTGSVAQKR
jgi:hypothetical protein